MIFSLYADFNVGFCGGFSRHGLKTHSNTKSDFEEVADYKNGGYFKIFFNYQRNMINNLDLKVEGFGGAVYGNVQQNGKPIVQPSFMGGIVAKGEIDFEEERSLYLMAGFQISSLRLSDFKFKGEENVKFKNGVHDDFFMTPLVGLGGSIYLNQRISLFAEITHSGWFFGHYIQTTIEDKKKIYFNNLRIGVGVNIKLT